MNRFNEKLRLIFVPYLVIAIGVIAGYTFLHWLIIIKLHAFNWKEEAINLAIPMALPWIPLIIWLRPRVRLLSLKKGPKSDPVGFYIFMSGIFIAVPAIIAQTYLETATGKLTRLTNIDQIGKQEATKYYTLKDFYFDKTNIGTKGTIAVTGKRNNYVDLNVYIAMPLLSSADDTLSTRCIAWYGIKYHKQIHLKLSKEERQERYRQFAQESQDDFDKRNVNQFIYFNRIGNTDDHDEYIAAIKNNPKYAMNSTTVLIPVNEPFAARNGSKLPLLLAIFAIGALILLLMLWLPKFNEEALDKFRSGVVERSTDAKDMLDFFIPKEGYFITPIIIDINILVFIFMVFSGMGFITFQAADLLPWGANFKPLTASGEWWRLLTSTFLHGGIMHLLVNMFGLIFVGLFLEPKLGNTKYTFIYLATGMLASLNSLWWHHATVSVGASGAIFGLYGVFLAFLLSKVYPKGFSKAFLLSTSIFIGYNLLMGLAGGIDNAAHMGGLVSGFVIGLVLAPQIKRDSPYDDQTQSMEGSTWGKQ